MTILDVAMARKKAARSPKNKERQGPGFRTVGLRTSNEYAEWLAELARFDRGTIANLADRAFAAYARAINFPKPPPERIP